MADKYCDHGAYTSAVVVGNTTSGNATLTVTSVTSGRLGLGAQITGPGIPANVRISGLGTGRGGAGTYTMSSNATATQTGITVNASNGGPALDPGWGVAQEGDGTAKTPATSATVSIPLSAYTAAAGATISIGGAMLTCVASGAGNNQFNAGSGTTLIDNIVTAINRTSNTVTVSAAATGWTTPKIQDCFFARRNGNNLEIMTRAGSATYNNNSLFKALTASFTGGAQIDAMFSGGVGGCWGWWFNHTEPVWPSNIARGAYGVIAATLPHAGRQENGDNVFIRSGKTLISHVYTGYNVSPPSTLATDLNNPVSHIIDDGTQWPEDGANPVFIHDHVGGGGASHVFSLANCAALRVEGKRYSNGTYSLQLFDNATPSRYIALRKNCAFGGFYMRNENVTANPYIGVGINQSGARSRYFNAKISGKGQGTFLQPVEGSFNGCGLFEDIVVDNTGASVPSNGVISVPTNWGGDAIFRNLRFENFVEGSKLFSGTYSEAVSSFTFENCKFNNVSVRGPFVVATQADDFSAFTAAFSQVGNRDFHIDNCRGFVEWNSARSQPTLGAVLLDGVTPWSIRLLTSTIANNVTFQAPLVAPRIAKINSLATGPRTISVEFCASDQTSWTKKDISILVTYEDASGDLVLLDSLDLAGGALTASSATWNQEAGGKVTYSDGATLYHNKYKLQINTPAGKDLPLGAEVGVLFRVHKTSSTSTQNVFVDPDVGIA